MNSNQLLDELISLSEELSKKVADLQQLPIKQLNNRPDSASWSALECIEHLNLYFAFYIPEISKRMAKQKGINASVTFRPGWLGNYFANAMKIKEGKFKKMKTFQDKNPIGSKLDNKTIEQFIAYQNELIKLLTEAKASNLNQIRTSITISKLIKLKLGDTFRFLIYHNERHVVQAINALN
ncbi:MAG: DinB family protein [Flavobacteriales bacterium]|jgi:methionyl-tRNA synthetase|nr:DinB family protein [Flavobacteriales bacterium]